MTDDAIGTLAIRLEFGESIEYADYLYEIGLDNDPEYEDWDE